MIKKTILAFAMVSLSLAACVGQLGPDGTVEAVESVEQAQIATAPVPGVGASCHVKSQGIYFGTMSTDGWCCGVQACNDKATCGVNYQKIIQTCGVCANLVCESGWLRPANMSGDVRLYSGDKSLLIVSDEKGYAIPFTPVKQ